MINKTKLMKRSLLSAFVLALSSGKAIASDYYFFVNISSDNVRAAESYEIPKPIAPNYDEYTEDEKNQGWVEFAQENRLSYTTSWSNLEWPRKDLESLPQESFPNKNPSGDINLSQNNIKNVYSFNSLNSVGGNLFISSNPLTSLQGLENIEHIGGAFGISGMDIKALWGLDSLNQVNGFIYINENPKLETLKGMENLLYVGGHIMLNNNPKLKDISSISNISSFNYIVLDNREYEVKALGDSSFCKIVKEDPSKAKYMKSGGMNLEMPPIDLYKICEIPENEKEWIKFAQDNSLEFEPNWSKLSWAGKGLSNLPESEYPNKNPSSINLSGNNLTNLDFLKGVESIAGSITLMNIPNFQSLDMRGIQNISYIGSFLDIQSQHIASDLKFDSNSNFCKGFKSGAINVRSGVNRYEVPYFSICNPTPEENTGWNVYAIKDPVGVDGDNWDKANLRGLVEGSALPSEPYPNPRPGGNDPSKRINLLGNPSLQDFGGLHVIESGYVLMEARDYAVKMPFNSNFCQGVRTRAISVKDAEMFPRDVNPNYFCESE